MFLILVNVYFGSCCLTPWRRSPRWLILLPNYTMTYRHWGLALIRFHFGIVGDFNLGWLAVTPPIGIAHVVSKHSIANCRIWRAIRDNITAHSSSWISQSLITVALPCTSTKGNLSLADCNLGYWQAHPNDVTQMTTKNKRTHTGVCYFVFRKDLSHWDRTILSRNPFTLYLALAI